VSKNIALRAEKPIFHNAQPFLVERSETVFLLLMFVITKLCDKSYGLT
jgi:hypothetical protein